MRSRRFLIIAGIIFMSAGAVQGQISAKSAGAPPVEKSAVVTRSFDLSGQGRETVEIEMTAPGKLEVKAEWTGSAAALALILNGPDRPQFYARQDGRSPLTLSFNFNQTHLAKGQIWKVSVALFGEGNARGKLEIRLPGPAEPAAPGKASAPGLSVAAPKTQTGVSAAQPTIKVTAPTSHTKVLSGGNCQVRWASTGSIDRVNIWMEYIDRNGQVTVMQLPGLGNDPVPNNGSRTIRIPADWSSEHGERWRVKIAGGGAEGRSEMLTIARPAFTSAGERQAGQQTQQTGTSGQQQTQAGGASTPAAGPASLKILSPNGGEEFISGHSYPIRWESTGDPGPLTLSIVHYRPPELGPPQKTYQPSTITIASNVPNTGEYSWTATRTGGPPAQFKLAIRGSNAGDESDGPITIAPYIELYIGEVQIYNPAKKKNWLLRTLTAIVTAGASEAHTVVSGGMSAVTETVIKETIDHIKDDKDEGSQLKRGTDIVVKFAVMQFGTRVINERVHSRITIMELPSRTPVEVLACESQLKGPLVSYICEKRFKTTGPLFKAGKYLIEIAVDPNKAVPEEPLFRDNNIKTIEFQLVEGDPNPLNRIR